MPAIVDGSGSNAANTAVLYASAGVLPAVSGANLTGLPSQAGRLLRGPQFLTSGTSYTTPAGCNNIMIELIGGGGGGGGAVGTGGNQATGGGGGNSIFATKFAAVSPNTTYTYAIGAGGTAGAAGNNAGGNGGTTSITISGTTYSVSGGVGGGGFSGLGTGTAGASGTATNMDSSTPGVAASGGNGGDCITPFQISYGADVSAVAQTNGSGTTQYGAAGGGGRSNTITGTTGGAGFQGCMRIWEYT